MLSGAGKLRSFAEEANQHGGKCHTLVAPTVSLDGVFGSSLRCQRSLTAVESCVSSVTL